MVPGPGKTGQIGARSALRQLSSIRAQPSSYIIGLGAPKSQWPPSAAHEGTPAGGECAPEVTASSAMAP